MEDRVKIAVSAPCYYEIRRELVRKGKGGEIVERSDEFRIEMSGVTVSLDERDPLGMDAIKQRVDLIREGIGEVIKADSVLAEAPAGDSDRSVRMANAAIDLFEMILKDLRVLGAGARIRLLALEPHAGAAVP